jgi:hypothetical protein
MTVGNTDQFFVFDNSKSLHEGKLPFYFFLPNLIFILCRFKLKIHTKSGGLQLLRSKLKGQCVRERNRVF